MKTIGIYPGTFQPADKSHYQVYKKLKSIVGGDVFVATTDREPVPDAPLNFGDKQQIWVRHGVPVSHIIRVKSLPSDAKEKWRPEEIYHTFPEHQTAAIVVMNPAEASLFSSRKKQNTNTYDTMTTGMQQELQEIYNELRQERVGNSHSTHEVWLDAKGQPSYFQPYDANNKDLSPLSEHAYVIVMDDTKIQGHPVSTANIRNVLGSTKYTDNQKKKFFRFVFGWFDVGLYQLMTQKFRNAHQVVYTGTGLQEMVYSVLKDLVAEDYSTTINTPDSSTNMTSISGDTTTDTQSQAKANSDMRQNLLQQKKELEAKAKQNKEQRDNYQTVVKNYDTFQKANDRDAIDAVNKQLSKPPSQPIQPTP